MNFYVGQKVVCIDAGGRGRWYRDTPVEGNIYTVTGLITVKRGNGLLLAEIKNTKQFRGAFSARRFRPAVTRKSETFFTQGADPSSDQFDNRRVTATPPALSTVGGE